MLTDAQIDRRILAFVFIFCCIFGGAMAIGSCRRRIEEADNRTIWGAIFTLTSRQATVTTVP